MLYLVIFLLLLAAAVMSLFIINISITLEYNRIGSDDNFSLSAFALGGIIKHKLVLPSPDFDKTGFKISRITEKDKKEKDVHGDKGKFSLTDIYQKYIQLRKFHSAHTDIIEDIKCYIIKRLILKEFNLRISIGTEDSFYTGIITGTLWIIAGAVASYLSNTFKTNKNCINITPNFSEKELVVELYCIFKTKIAHIIVVGLKLLMRWLSTKTKLKTSIGGDLSG